ncbi:MAG: twin-arginine translocation signal domain-containing protein, partial [Nitrososphaeria archaeon]
MPNRRDFLKIGTAFGAGALAGGAIQYFIGKNEIDQLKEALKRSSLNIEPTINVYNWYDYIAPGVCDDFSDEYGV